MSRLTNQIIKRAERAPAVRFGTIESVGDGLAAVRMGGAVIEGLAWRASYLPVVGERVAVLQDLILGAVAEQPRVYQEPETILLPEVLDGWAIWGLALINQHLFSDSWDDDLSTPEIDPKLPQETAGPTWELGGSFAHRAWAGRGSLYRYDYEGYLNYMPAEARTAIAIETYYWRSIYNDEPTRPIERLVPADAVIQAIALRIPMRAGAPDFRVPPGLREFKIHAMSAQPTALTPEGMIHAGIEPLTVSANPGNLVTVPLGQDWLDALEQGDIAGFYIFPGDASYIHFADEYHLDEGGNRVWTTDNLFRIAISYVRPISEDGGT